MPAVKALAAVSCGIIDGVPLLDLDYREDSTAEADANFVMTEDGHWIEVQASAEGRPLSQDEFICLTELARKGIYQLLELWKDTP
jgi:ribonuclease PH